MKENEFILPKKIDHLLATLSKYYAKKGEDELREIVENSIPEVQPGLSYDNWDGGIYSHGLILKLPEEIYISLVDKKSQFESQIASDLNKINGTKNESFEEVSFDIDTMGNKDCRRSSGSLLLEKEDQPKQDLWEPSKYCVFLSHKVEVKKEVAELKNSLKIYGVTSFVAHEDIRPTKEWQNEIEYALQTMDAFIALLTEDYHKSDWTDQEVGYALCRGVPIISLNLGKNPYGFIGKFQALKHNWKEAPLAIAKILIRHSKMVDAYINAVCECSSFDEGNKLSQLLPSLEKDILSMSQIDRIIEAYNNNDQVKGCYGFNGRLRNNYGPGLVHYLKKLSNGKFSENEDGDIVRLE